MVGILVAITQDVLICCFIVRKRGNDINYIIFDNKILYLINERRKERQQEIRGCEIIKVSCLLKMMVLECLNR